MPFPLRTVAPLKLCRLEEGAAAAQRDKDGHARRSGAGLLRLFDSLEEVCSRSLVSLLWQLSDLSRWAGDIFGGIQSEADSLGRRSVRLQCRLESLKGLAGCLDHRKVKVPVSNLDEESRWTVHYTAPWHQQENVFLPSTRPPCVEELHRQAKLNLKSVLRECDKLRRDGCRSSQYYSQGPTFSSSSNTIYGSYQDDYEEIEQKCSTPSPEEEKLIPVKRPKTPTLDELSDINTQTNWTKSLPLPTPEEKMRQQAQAVPTDVIPINVTGENFDRQASIRRSLIYTDSVVRRPKKMKRRKTITGIPDNIQRELGTTESTPQSVTYNFRNDHRFSNHSHDINSRSESGYTVENIQDKVKQNTKHCGFKPCGNDTTLHMSKCAIPGCSSPDSLERVLAKEDSHSLYSVDNDICYPSMHVDSDVQSVKSCSENGFGNPRHSVINVFARTEKKSLGDFASSNDKSLTRSISFKKARKPPLPPSRTDSLRRIPKNKPQSSGQVLDDKLIASLQHSLQLNLQCKNGSSPSQSPCSDYDDPWVLRSRSQSTVSASSSMMSATGLNMYSICAVTPSQSDTSSIKSEYTDQWSYYSDYPGTPDDHLKSAAIHSSNTLPKLIDYNASHLGDESRASIQQVPSGVAKTKAISPEKSQRVTSPSSGYSSQSNTPTALTPVPVVLKSMSTGNAKSKMKPRVPERKSSLLSSVSVSSSSTSLSSNTSAEGTIKKTDPTPSFPPVTSSPLVSLDSNDPLLPPPPPALADVTDLPQPPESPSFPPPPPDVVTNASFPRSIGWFSNQDISNHSSHSSLPDSSHHLPPTFPTSVPPPAPPLDPKFMRDGHKPVPYSFKKRNLEASCNNAKRPLNKDDLPRPAMPLITTEALQMVQLRSVKKAMKSEVEQSAESASKASPQEKNQDAFSAFELPFRSHLSGGYNDTLDAVGGEAQRSPVCSPNSRRSAPTSAKMPRNAISTINSFARESQPDKAEEALVQNQDSCSNLACSSLQEQSGFLSKLQGTLPNKKPPPVSKKPKLFLLVPPPQPDVTTEKIAVGETAKSIPSTTMKDAEIAWYSQVNNSPTDGFGSYEMESSDLVPEGEAVSPTSCESRSLQPQQEETVSSCERSSPDRNVDSISGTEKQFSQGDESSEAIEADAATSFLLQSPSHGEGSEIMAVPSRPRTTEDLFAAIHRSKRKVLGRKDSEDDHALNHSPSPPVTPTGSSPNLPSLRQAGSIQRNIRKSSTSNDNFKALLLKKGSRSDTSSRMSAAEMLKNTDPRFQRAKVDSAGDLSESTVGSPTKTKRPQEEWAKSEGLMPRSLSLSSTRYSRSRTPPSAASSKYSARNRIQSSPMTVIREGDVEVVESAENRTRRFSEEEPPDVFESDDTDINENRDSTEDDNMLVDLLS
ncbi:NHS-like protein 1 isoform 6-T6 [Vipera latastei]